MILTTLKMLQKAGLWLTQDRKAVIMQGFKEAMAEYEAKMNDPFGDEETDADYEPVTDPYEEMLLEQQIESYVRGW